MITHIYAGTHVLEDPQYFHDPSTGEYYSQIRRDIVEEAFCGSTDDIEFVDPDDATCEKCLEEYGLWMLGTL